MSHAVPRRIAAKRNRKQIKQGPRARVRLPVREVHVGVPPSATQATHPPHRRCIC